MSEGWRTRLGHRWVHMNVHCHKCFQDQPKSDSGPNILVLTFEEIPLAPFDQPQPSKEYPDNHPAQRSCGSKDARVNAKDTYLAQIHNGQLVLGKFTEQWYGWTFNWHLSITAGVQLDMVERLWVMKRGEK